MLFYRSLLNDYGILRNTRKQVRRWLNNIEKQWFLRFFWQYSGFRCWYF